mgnify:CR=1 FL=1
MAWSKGLQIKDLFDHLAIGGVKEVGDFPTDGGAMPIGIVPTAEAVPSVSLGKLNGLLGWLGEAESASGISSVRSDDEMSGFE